jgi:hypothetical protein
LYVNDEAVEIIPLPEPEKPKEPLPNAAINLSERQRIAEEVAAKYGSKTIWISESAGYLEPCPGQQLHTTGDGDRNCKIDLDRVPTTHCFHDHCRAILEAINRELRSRIGEAERAEAAGTPQPAGCADADVALPRPYVPPPLDLLPEVLQKFIRVGAKATDVDRAFIFLPVLSETAACIGISRSIRLKESYVEPSIVWTSNIAPTGDGKTPGMRTAIRLQLLYEMKLKQENEKNAKEHETELAKWESDTQSEAR